RIGRARARLRKRPPGHLQLPGRFGLLPPVRIRGVRRPRRVSGGVLALLHAQASRLAALALGLSGLPPSWYTRGSLWSSDSSFRRTSRVTRQRQIPRAPSTAA